MSAPEPVERGAPVHAGPARPGNGASPEGGRSGGTGVNGQARWTQFALLLVSTMTVMAGATIAPALPSMVRFFGDAPGADLWVRLVLTLPGLFTAIGAPLAGVLIDRFGRRRLLLASIVLYGIAGTAGGAVSSLGLVLLSRALLGLSVAGIMTTVTTLIADYYLGGLRSTVMGRQAAFMGFGGMVFLMAGGALADLSWRAPFLVYLLGFVWLPLVVRHVAEPPVSRRDQAGAAPPPAEPIPWSIAGMLYALGFFGMALFYMVPVQIPFFLERLGVASGALVGMALAAVNLVSALTSMRYGRVKQRLGYRGTFALVFGLLGAGYGIVAMAQGYATVMAGLLVSGVGIGLLMPNLNNWVGDVAPVAVRGKVLGGLTTCIFLGQFLSPVLTQGVISRAGFGWGFGGAGLLAGLVALGFLRGALRRRGA